MNNRPSETDILRFVVRLAEARGDEAEVKRIIDEEMGGVHEVLQASILAVSLRVMTAQMYGALARHIECTEPDLVDNALFVQTMANDGLIEPGGRQADGPVLTVIDGERP